MVKTTIRERKNDNPSGNQVFICCHWKKHFEEEIEDFWLRGRGRFSTPLLHVCMYIHSVQYSTCVYVYVVIYMDCAGVQLEQACS